MRKQVSISAACDWYGLSRQAYYQARQCQLQRSDVEKQLIEWGQEIRQRHP